MKLRLFDAGLHKVLVRQQHVQNLPDSSIEETTILVACDVYRPAAIKQLQVNGEGRSTSIWLMGDKQNPVDIAKYSRNTHTEEWKQYRDPRYSRTSSY